MAKILIAEDDKFLSTAYRAKFSKLGHELIFASDGQETLTLVESKMPNLILLDIMMPKKDGFEVLTELKKNPKYAKIPVIVASNLGQKEDKDKAASLGANDFIVKSEISLDDLAKKVNSYLKP